MIDVFSLIGTTNAAKEVLSAHPNPHRLRVCLGLEAKNPAFILPDANMSTAVAEIKAGGQDNFTANDHLQQQRLTCSDNDSTQEASVSTASDAQPSKSSSCIRRFARSFSKSSALLLIRCLLACLGLQELV